MFYESKVTNTKFLYFLKNTNKFFIQKQLQNKCLKQIDFNLFLFLKIKFSANFKNEKFAEYCQKNFSEKYHSPCFFAFKIFQLQINFVIICDLDLFYESKVTSTNFLYFLKCTNTSSRICRKVLTKFS